MQRTYEQLEEFVIAYQIIDIIITDYSSKSDSMGLDKERNEHKHVYIFLSINHNICFGCSKNRIIETVLLSTHNICFG